MAEPTSTRSGDWLPVRAFVDKTSPRYYDGPFSAPYGLRADGVRKSLAKEMLSG